MVSHVGYDQPSLYPIVRSVPVASSRITVLWSSWNALQQDVGVTDGHGSLAGSRRVVLPLVVSLSLLSTRPIRMSYHLVSMSWQSSGLQQGVGRLDVVRRSLAGRLRIVLR